jgi:hypothetical protein
VQGTHETTQEIGDVGHPAIGGGIEPKSPFIPLLTWSGDRAPMALTQWLVGLEVGGLVDELEADYQEPKGEGEAELTVGNARRYSAARDRSEDASYS